MAAAVLVPCGVRLRSDFNALAPGRAKASDGWIGDTAHQLEVSDHNPDETGSVPIHDADRVNEVHAIDVDVDLRESGLTMEKVVQFLLGRCRSGAETRLRYIIYNRRIWEASNGWKQRTYTGPSPHTEHAHFSFSYDTAREADTSSWGFEEIDMPTAKEIVDELLTRKVAFPYGTVGDTRTVGGQIGYIQSRDTTAAATAAAVKAALTPQLNAIATAAGADTVDEGAIVAGILAGLTPEKIAAAIPQAYAAAVVNELRDRLAASGTNS